MDLDIVYLWCDDADPIWHAKRQKHMPQKADEQAICDGRFVQNDELKYSLRSVAKYMPWVRNIFIISDHQIPSWLNTNHPKIKMINHEEIIDKKYLPLFNSSAIETGLANIPNLSEYFAYMNDDTFLYQPITEKNLFIQKKPLVRLCVYHTKENPSQYERCVLKMQNYIAEIYGKKITYFPHHNLDIYSKSDYLHGISMLPQIIELTLRSRFRSDNDWHRSFIGYKMICEEHAKLKVIDKYQESFLHWLKHNLIDWGSRDSKVISLKCKNYKRKLSHSRPLFFCMEDGEMCKPYDRIRVRNFLTELFPNKSEFEK